MLWRKIKWKEGGRTSQRKRKFAAVKIMKGVPEQVALQRPGVVQERGKSKCKGPGAGACLVWTRKSKEASAAKARVSMRGVVGGEAMRGRVCKIFKAMVRAALFSLCEMRSQWRGFGQRSCVLNMWMTEWERGEEGQRQGAQG